MELDNIAVLSSGYLLNLEAILLRALHGEASSYFRGTVLGLFDGLPQLLAKLLTLQATIPKWSQFPLIYKMEIMIILISRDNTQKKF